MKPSVRRSVRGERFALDGNWSALCTGRLGGCGCRRHSDLEAATSAWVHWSPARLMHRLGRRPPAEHEADYYAHITEGASNPGRFTLWWTG